MTKLPDGLYDLLITQAVERELSRIGDHRRASVESLPSADANLIFGRYVGDVIREALRGVPEDERLQRQTEVVNELIRSIGAMLPHQVDADHLVREPAQRLAAIYRFDALRVTRPAPPEIPLSQSDLLVNAHGEPRIGSILEREIASADRIDAIIAFIRWSGLRLIAPQLKAFVERGGRLRIITTTYTGSTERVAIERLLDLGAEVKVSYHTDATRLHAKAWLFYRDSGFSTVFIGSSNLSTTAMREGLEWNVRLSHVDAPTIVAKFEKTFEAYWAQSDFETYVRGRDDDRFDKAVASASAEQSTISYSAFEITPWPHQREMLDELAVERYRHNRWKNLVVAATGTGKTVVAALDYRQLNSPEEPLPWSPASRPLSLLFVAHRKEILAQSVATFRTVMRDGSFGELYVDGRRPDEWRHVFASIQSLSAAGIDAIQPEAFDVVIIDEFHHAAAPTYRALLERLAPKVLLGLTATPERTDAESVLEWFGGRMAVELRLWDALDRGLLSPFHYFGIHDNVDISLVAWRRGRYDERALEHVYTGNDARVAQIIAQLEQKIAHIRGMRALGFCVGVHHAEFMAQRFREADIPSEAVVGATDSESRDRALRKLKAGEINCVFAVDIFNEGVDVPEVDTVMFLRPTESALIFLQQLGRGLRRTREKDCLTVLDFIGNANRHFRFDLRYRALTGATRREVEEQITDGFPYLPAGCSIQLDREATHIVLQNLKASIGSTFKSLVAELKAISPPVTLARFLHDAALEPEDLYATQGWSWTRLQREAGRNPSSTGDKDELLLTRGLPRLLHMDDERRLSFLMKVLSDDAPPNSRALSIIERRILEGFLLTIFADDERDVDTAIRRLWTQRAVRSEIVELLAILDDRAAHRTSPLSDEVRGFAEVPLAIHARYNRNEVLTAIGRSTFATPYTHREGPLWDEATNTDYFFITLEKSEKYYSPSTRYRDYAVSPDVFHWESQSQTRETSPTGQRYIHHVARGSNVMLFVRPRNRDSAGRTVAFTFLGPASYMKHTAERPMAILWKLHRPMPLDFFGQANVVAG